MINLMPIINFVCMIGTLFSITKAIKDRQYLRGVSIIGSGLTFTAMFLLSIYLYFDLNDLLSFGFVSPTVVYWLLLFVYSIKIKLKEGK